MAGDIRWPAVSVHRLARELAAEHRDAQSISSVHQSSEVCCGHFHRQGEVPCVDALLSSLSAEVQCMRTLSTSIENSSVHCGWSCLSQFDPIFFGSL
jgi:hypothetical protein